MHIYIYIYSWSEKFTHASFLILCCNLNDPQLCFFCLVIVVYESLVCPEPLNCLLFFGKILQLPQILWFSSIFVYLNPFQQWLYDFEIQVSHWGQLRDSFVISYYYRRFKHSLMLQKEKPCMNSLNRMKMCIFFLFCLNIIFFFI